MDRFGTETVTTDMPEDVTLREMSKRNVIHCASLVRREAIDLSRAFDVPADPKTEHEDWLFWLSVLRQGWKARKQRAVHHYRRHPEGKSLTKAWAGNTYFERRGLRHETITLFVALSGRSAVWPRFQQFLQHVNKASRNNSARNIVQPNPFPSIVSTPSPGSLMISRPLRHAT